MTVGVDLWPCLTLGDVMCVIPARFYAVVSLDWKGIDEDLSLLKKHNQRP